MEISWTTQTTKAKYAKQQQNKKNSCLISSATNLLFYKTLLLYPIFDLYSRDSIIQVPKQ